jgi:hypothetical protein
MSEHQETIAQTVRRIEVSFDKIKQYSEKADQYRISAGKQLVELKVRIEAGEAGKGVKWWAWYADHFKNRSRRDAQRVMALANADNPEDAAEEEREKNREAKAAQREREARTDVSRTPADPRMTEEDYAAQMVQDALASFKELRDVVDDHDLLRELFLQKVTFAFKGEDSPEDSAGARKTLYARAEEEESAPVPSPEKKPRGRPPGSKNRPKASDTPTPEPARARNDADTNATAEARKAAAAAAEAAGPEPAPDDGSIPEYLRRAPEVGAAL